MATPRALDPDRLKALLQENPHMGRDELAGRLTAHNRELGCDVTVTPRLVTAAISRWRPVWEADGFVLERVTPPRRELVRLLMRNVGRNIADQWQQDAIVKKLRYIDRMRQGLPVPRNRVSTAQKFEAQLRAARRVVDLTEGGRPYVRAAFPDELDAAGELIEIVSARRPHSA